MIPRISADPNDPPAAGTVDNSDYGVIPVDLNPRITKPPVMASSVPDSVLSRFLALGAPPAGTPSGAQGPQQIYGAVGADPIQNPQLYGPQVATQQQQQQGGGLQTIVVIGLIIWGLSKLGK